MNIDEKIEFYSILDYKKMWISAAATSNFLLIKTQSKSLPMAFVRKCDANDVYLISLGSDVKNKWSQIKGQLKNLDVGDFELDNKLKENFDRYEVLASNSLFDHLIEVYKDMIEIGSVIGVCENKFKSKKI